MSRPARLGLFVDFGSTFTKLRAVSLTDGRLVATAQTPTTIDAGLAHGLDRGLGQLGISKDRFDVRFGCSSAAGGLRIVAVGLVRGLTAEAARRSALGAGGKIVETFAGELTDADLAEIERLHPDLIVLAGGIDGGDTACIVANASRIAQTRVPIPTVVAGNRNARDDVGARFREGERGRQREVIFVDNVLPAIDVVDPEPCSRAIRDVFIRRIIHAKGLTEVAREFDAGLVPTPNAVLSGVRLLADGPGSTPGLGELVCVDVGGATTDVYSVASGRPNDSATVVSGLPEPYVKRTVEGDLGVRVNAMSVLEAEVGNGAVGPQPTSQDWARRVKAQVELLPGSAAEAELDADLAAAATRTAMRRHAGRIEDRYGPGGRYKVQRGKDLSAVPSVVGTGGVLAQAPTSAACARVLAAARSDPARPTELLPSDPRLYADRDYLLFAVGLLAEVDASAGYALARASITRVDADRSAS